MFTFVTTIHNRTMLWLFNLVSCWPIILISKIIDTSFFFVMSLKIIGQGSLCSPCPIVKPLSSMMQQNVLFLVCTFCNVFCTLYFMFCIYNTVISFCLFSCSCCFQDEKCFPYAIYILTLGYFIPLLVIATCGILTLIKIKSVR